jgi:hypothetical protein
MWDQRRAYLRNTYFAAASLGLMSHASAQTELYFYFDTNDGTTWNLTAELLNPTGTVLAAIADLGFTFRGANIANFEYNSAFDSDFFGDATVNVTGSSVDFIGSNTLPPLNNAAGVDSSNPLHIASFTADHVNLCSFRLVGQVTGAYAGVPFADVFFYQNADGSSGDTAWSIFCPTPSTATACILMGAVVARRRR